jgi:hypothetical protein
MQLKGDTGTQSQEGLEVMITEQLGSGKNRTEVVRNLVESGMTESEANQMVERVLSQLKKTASEEEFSGSALVPAILGGLIAAVIGGAIWAAIAIWTGSEIGYVAIGVGLLCGLGVVMLSQGKRGMPLQVVAVVASVLGIVIGKYGTTYYDYQQWLIEEGHPAATVEQYGLFSGNMMQVFAENLPNMMSGYDLLWVGLAVYTAWSIPKASALKI